MDRIHPVSADQHALVDRSQRAAAGRLHPHREPGLGRVAHRGPDVVGVRRAHDQRRSVGDGQGEGLDLVIDAEVAGLQDRPGRLLVERGGQFTRVRRHGHDLPSSYLRFRRVLQTEISIEPVAGRLQPR
jgi:hypothetical protein